LIKEDAKLSFDSSARIFKISGKKRNKIPAERPHRARQNPRAIHRPHNSGRAHSPARYAQWQRHKKSAR